jgi:hypothetical protein
VWRPGGAEEQALPRVSFVQSGGKPLESFASRSDYYAKRKGGDTTGKPNFVKITLTYCYILPFCRNDFLGRSEYRNCISNYLFTGSLGLKDRQQEEKMLASTAN